MRDAHDKEILARALAEADQLSPARAAIVRALVPLVGLEPLDAAYQEAVYPYDPPSQRRALALRQSSCGLTAEIGWRAAGVADPRLMIAAGTRAVTGGTSYPLALEVDDAKRWGAWREPGPMALARPLPGDGVVVGCSSCRGVWSKGQGAFEHIFTVVATDYAVSSSSEIVHSIEGGQPGIHTRTRALVVCGPRGDELWAAALDDEGAYRLDPADMRPTKGRRVLGWYDAYALKLGAA